MDIATSSARNDSGLFELSFRDERYLPFEGEDPEDSEWTIELGGKWRVEGEPEIIDWSAFDFETISDVVLSINYTAQNGTDALKRNALNDLRQDMAPPDGSAPLAQPFSLRSDFPTEWHLFVNGPSEGDRHTVTLPLTRDRFPYFAQVGNRRIQISRVELYPISDRDGASNPVRISISSSSATEPGDWTLEMERSPDASTGVPPAGILPPVPLPPTEILPRVPRDIVLVCRYSLVSPSVPMPSVPMPSVPM
jgi:hypothetical protein